MEEHLWKRVLYDFRDGGSPVRKRKRTSLSTAHDEEEIVTDLVQGARVSGHKAVSKMTKPEVGTRRGLLLTVSSHSDNPNNSS
jgi:hypothetical protein